MLWLFKCVKILVNKPYYYRKVVDNCFTEKKKNHLWNVIQYFIWMKMEKHSMKNGSVGWLSPRLTWLHLISIPYPLADNNGAPLQLGHRLSSHIYTQECGNCQIPPSIVYFGKSIWRPVPARGCLLADLRYITLCLCRQPLQNLQPRLKRCKQLRRKYFLSLQNWKWWFSSIENLNLIINCQKLNLLNILENCHNVYGS